ncbi:STAS domain-containing protein [Pseudobacillus wudalianchiensis]|uniref:Modulator protein n=1 Tax=Pseudobacillus wudalianchiensis TaxID=1743143 RepID=A0A1B9AGA4_9BACI|nr:STAS domain-containing protein [Bacillus wudalianchiensis]OCA82855.1 modulator protein [Bacillus wudalianchiensis]
MKDELRYIGKKIVDNHLTLAQRIEGTIAAENKKTGVKNNATLAERRKYRAQLIVCFGKALYEDTELIAQEVKKWGRRTAELAIQYNISLNNLLREVATYRTVIWDVFTEELEQRKFAAITMLDVSKMIDPLIDQVFKVIGEVYEAHNERLMKVAYTALEELSVPVVPVAEGVAAIPLVGAIDTHRAKLVMEVALNEGARMNLSHMIIDVSGVPIIDTMVADQLFQVIRALKLTGVKATLTGIRPEIAQTIVNLGIHFDELNPCVNLQEALKNLGFKRVEAQ